jgi:hypothetical protein
VAEQRYYKEVNHWRDEYIARSEILQKIQNWFNFGWSDEQIGKMFDSPEEWVWKVRTKYKFFRIDECPDCGCREYIKGKECPNKHCISVWSQPFWRQFR